MQIESEGMKVKRDRASRAALVTTITILASIAIWFVVLQPAIQSDMRSIALGKEENYVKAADLAMIYYLADHGDRFPQLSGDLTPLLKPYMKDPDAVSAVNRFTWNNKLSGMKTEELYDTEELWMLYSKAPGTNMYAVGFAGSHVHYAAPRYLAHVLQQGEQILRDSPEHHRLLRE